MTTGQRILIFGGTFNPPTFAHEAIIRACLELPGFDEVWVMPSGDRVDKKMTVSEEHRLQLLGVMKRAAFADNPRLKISDFDLKLPRPTEMRDSLRELARVYPDTEFWFAYGGDSYRSMHTWLDADKFRPGLHAVVFTEQPLPADTPAQVVQMHLPESVQEVSSTEIRNTLANGGDASRWADKAVLAYCMNHRLYKA
jgi:nicotinate-nucleotide adenylyltransferase